MTKYEGTCSITGEPILVPAITNNGQVYEFTAIARWLTLRGSQHLDPNTNDTKAKVTSLVLIRTDALALDAEQKEAIADACIALDKVRINADTFKTLEGIQALIEQKKQITPPSIERAAPPRTNIPMAPPTDDSTYIDPIYGRIAGVYTIPFDRLSELAGYRRQITNAITMRNVDRVRELLNNEQYKPYCFLKDLNDDHSRPLLNDAVMNGNIQIIRMLLSDPRVYDPNEAVDHGYTPLVLAASRDDVECVQALLEHPHINLDAEPNVYPHQANDAVRAPVAILTSQAGTNPSPIDQLILNAYVMKMINHPAEMKQLFTKKPQLLQKLASCRVELWNQLQRVGHDLVRDGYVGLLNDILASKNRPLAEQHPLYSVLRTPSSTHFLAPVYAFFSPADIMPKIRTELSRVQPQPPAPTNR